MTAHLEHGPLPQRVSRNNVKTLHTRTRANSRGRGKSVEEYGLLQPKNWSN